MWKIYLNKGDNNIHHFVSNRRGLWFCTGKPLNDMMPSVIIIFIGAVFYAFFLEMYFSANGFHIQYLILYILVLIISLLLLIFPFEFVGISNTEITYKKKSKEKIVIPFTDIIEYNPSTFSLRIKTKAGESFVLDLRNYKMSCVTMIKALVQEKLEKKLGV